MQAYNKAIAAVIVPVILLGLTKVGISPEMPVGEAVEYVVMALITAFAVWAIPNKK